MFVTVLFLLLQFCASVFGAHRELLPSKAPSNLTLLEINQGQVLIQWDPIEPDTVRGSFKGYLVRTWNHAGSLVYAFPPDVTRASIDFFPFSKNFITVSVRNEKYVGPPSEAISFDTPQREPQSPQTLHIFTLSNKSVLIRWSKPSQPNGILLGYRIYCREMNDTFGEIKRETSHLINDPDKFQAKLTGLEEGVKYQIGVSAVNCAGESDVTKAGIVLGPHTPVEPFPSRFVYKTNYTTPKRDEKCYKTLTSPAEEEDEEVDDYYDYLLYNHTNYKETTPSPVKTDYEQNCLVDCLVLWMPDVSNNPGEYFYLKYRVRGETDYTVTEPETSEDFILLRNFDACKKYEMVIVAVDGEFSTESGTVFTTPKLYSNIL